MSWGFGAWGGSPWGGLASASGMVINGAKAVTTHTIRIELSLPPREGSQWASGDVLNPLTWTVTRLDSLGAVDKTYTVLSVESLGASTYDIRVLEALDGHLVTHTVESATLLSAGLLFSPVAFAMHGVIATALATTAAQAASQYRAMVDIANPPFADGQGGEGGTWVIKGGDYAHESGLELKKKLILRRLGPDRDGFLFLKDFGLGLKVEEPLPFGDVATLKTQIERQVAAVPGIEDVKVALEIARVGIVSISISFRDAESDETGTVTRKLGGLTARA